MAKINLFPEALLAIIARSAANQLHGNYLQCYLLHTCADLMNSGALILIPNSLFYPAIGYYLTGAL